MDTQQTVALRTCSQCGCESPQDSLFCIECGESLISNTGPTTYLRGPVCTQCGHEELPGARFCRLCGQALAVEDSIGQPWAAPVSAPAPHLQRPAVASRPQPIPQVVIPAAPVLAKPAAKAARRQSNIAGIIVVLGFVLLLVTKAFTWPLMLLVLGAAYVVSQLEQGRTNHALAVLAGLVIGAILWRQPRLLGMIGGGWPFIFFFFFFVNKGSKRRP